MTQEIGFQLQEKLAALEAALLANDPQLPVLMREIHTKLKEDEESVTIMTPEEVGLIVRGCKKLTDTEISAKMVKESKTAGGKKLASISLDQL